MRYLLIVFTIVFNVCAFAKAESAGLDVQALALQKSYLQSIDCRSPSRLTKVLKKALKDTEDLTAKGNHASVFEEMMIHNPACFIQAINNLPAHACLQIKNNYINETFFYPRTAIRQALSTAKNYEDSCIAS